MKILSLGESPCINSGFANVLREINQHWIEQGHEVRQLGWCHMPNTPNPYPYKIYPVKGPVGYENYFGVNIFDEIINEYNPDIVFSLADVYMITWIPMMKTRPKFRWISYTPIDSAPIPHSWYSTLVNAEQVITYSKFGIDELEKLEINYNLPPKMIYHGYNPKQFYPLAEDEIQKVKEENKLEEKFVFGFIGTNSTRKHPTHLLEAWSEFKKGKEDAVLLMHTKISEERQGYDLKEILMQFNLNQGDTIFISGANPIGGVPIEHMNKLYNMLDVQVTAASCEGFGLPLLEAAACGTPSIGVDYSSIPELIGGQGELVKPIAYYYHRPLCQRRPIIDIQDFKEKMDRLYYDEELRKDYSQKCIEFAKDFEWEKLLPKFDVVLKEVMETENVAFKKRIKEKSFVEV